MLKKAIMRSVYAVVAVFSLLSGGQSAPVDTCESLTQQLEIQAQDQLLGKWIAIAESTDLPEFKLMTAMFVDSSWVKVTAANKSDTIEFYQVQKSLGQCFTLKYNMTLKNSTLSIEKPLRGSEVLLKTSCPDCLIGHATYSMGKKTYRSLQLLSRRNKVSDAELEEYNKQVQCLNLPPPAVLDPQKALCQEESLSQDTQNRDLTAVMNEMGPDLLGVFESLANKEDGVNSLMKLIYHSLVEEKEN